MIKKEISLNQRTVHYERNYSEKTGGCKPGYTDC